jgi:hypothetical protein
MVETAPRPMVATRMAAARQRWHLPASWQRSRTVWTALTRIDDDPVLLCDCAEGAAHTCG